MARRVDGNHSAIVAEIRASGLATVQSIASVGKGVPDIVVGVPVSLSEFGISGLNLLFEIKVSDKARDALINRVISGGPYDKTEYEARWLNEWKGHSQVVSSTDQIMEIVQTITRKLK